MEGHLLPLTTDGAGADFPHIIRTAVLLTPPETCVHGLETYVVFSTQWQGYGFLLRSDRTSEITIPAGSRVCARPQLQNERPSLRI
jgi:hypothetical protein